MQVEICPKNYKLEAIKAEPETSFITELDQKIKRIVENEGFIKYNITKKCLSTNGGNYLGELYEIDVEGKTIHGDKELHIFVKKIINGEESVKILSVSEAYKNELYVYEQLSKIFDKLQEDANIPLEERYKVVTVLEGTDTNMMIMENIAKKGFKTYHRMDVPSIKFLELCIQNIAKFHGLSFVIKEKYPEYFDKNLKSLKHLIKFGEEYKQMIESVSATTLSCIDKSFRENVEKIYNNIFEKYSTYAHDETIKKCLCHGDYRPNNIMMKEENDEVQEVISIDYQIIHYGCPIFDLLYLIYVSTDREIRKNHLTSLKDLYYSSLENFLKFFDIDANVVYPRKEYERAFREKLDYGLMVGLQFLPFMFVLDEEVPDMTEFSNDPLKVDRRYKDRIQDIIEEFTELGFI